VAYPTSLNWHLSPIVVIDPEFIRASGHAFQDQYFFAIKTRIQSE
jgi:hypothetical protein